MKASLVDWYPRESLGVYPGRPVALANGRALVQVQMTPHPERCIRFFLLDYGKVERLTWEPQGQVLEALSDPGMVVFPVGQGVALLGTDRLVLWDSLEQAPSVLDVENPLAHDESGRCRTPAVAIAVADSSSATVLLTQPASRVDHDAFCRVDWSGGRARWTSDPKELTWEDIPFKPTAATRPPALRAVVQHGNSVIAHHTGRQFLGSAGDPKYGMDWSVLLQVDPVTSRARPIADVEHGRGMFSADGKALLVRALRANKVFLYDLAGMHKGSFSITSSLGGGAKSVSIGDFRDNDLWTWSPSELAGIGRCRIE